MSDLPPYISGAELTGLLPGASAVDALEAGLLARGGDLEEVPRIVLDHQLGDFLLMPASGPEGAGAKLVTVVPGNGARDLPLINGLYLLFSRDTLSPELLIDGGALTRLRTAAVSALAARHLARPESSRLVVFGAGAQAEAHIWMMREVLPIETVAVIGASPRSERAAQLVERLRGAGVQARIGAPDDVAVADVVCTCTTAAAPVFDSSRLAPGAHVNAIGAYKPSMRELDFQLCGSALLVVETLAAARAEAGDLIQAVAAGVLGEDRTARELPELLRGEVRRVVPDQPSVFKSVGLAIEDLIVARAAAERLAA